MEHAVQKGALKKKEKRLLCIAMPGGWRRRRHGWFGESAGTVRDGTRAFWGRWGTCRSFNGLRMKPSRACADEVKREMKR